MGDMGLQEDSTLIQYRVESDREVSLDKLRKAIDIIPTGGLDLEAPLDQRRGAPAPDTPEGSATPAPTQDVAPVMSSEADARAAMALRSYMEAMADPTLGSPPLLRPLKEGEMGSLNPGPGLTLRDIMTDKLGEGWVKSKFGGELESVGLLDMVPGVDLALAFDDMGAIRERMEKGEEVSVAEQAGAMIAIPLSIMGAGGPAKKAVQGFGDQVNKLMSWFTKEPLSAQIVKAQEAAKAKAAAKFAGPVVAAAQAEDMLGTLKSFHDWAGADIANYLPDKVLNVNYSKIGTTDDIRSAVAATVDTITIPKNVKTWGQTESSGNRMADSMGLDADKLRQRLEKLGRLDAEIHASRVLLANSAASVRTAAKFYNPDMSEAEKAVFLRVVQQHVDIMAYTSGMAALPGRALNAMKILAAERGKDMKALERAIMEFGGTGRIDELAKALAAAPDADSLNQMAKRGVTSKFWDAATELWINGILSGVKTMAVNMTGNALFTVWQVPERFIQGSIGAARVGAAKLGGQPVPIDRVYIGESLALMYGMLESIPEVMRSFVTAWKTGNPIVGDITRAEVPRFKAISSEHLEISGMMGRFVDTIGAVVRTPTRFMLAQDEAFKAMGRRMQLNAMAYSEGMKTPGTFIDKAKVMQAVRSDPTASDEILESMDDFAHYITFQTEMGPTGKRLQSLAHTRFSRFDIPIFRFIIPFIRTPANIYKAGILERNPLFAPFTRKFQEDFRAGGARRDAALGKLATGSALAAYAAYLSAQGVLTGAGPADPKQRTAWLNAGYKPYALRVQTGQLADGTPTYEWRQYQRVEPISFLMGAVADGHEFMKYAFQDDPERQGEESQYLALITAALAENTTNKTFLTGASDFFNVMNDPKRYTESWMQRFAATAIPNIVRDITIMGTPFSDGDPYRREIESIGDAFRAKIPGLSSTLPPLRNIWGDPLTQDVGWLGGIYAHGLPIAVGQRSKHPIDHEIMRLGVDGVREPETGELKVYREALISPPSRNQRGVRLTAWQMDRAITLAGAEIEMDVLGVGQNMNQREALNYLVSKHEGYARMGPAAQAEMISFVHDQYNEQATRRLIEEDEELAAKIDEGYRFDIEKARDLGNIRSQ